MSNANSVYPFLITQIGECQNEFVVAPEFIVSQKDAFSEKIYREIQTYNIGKSFMRYFSYEGYIVIANYWATRAKEEKSGRDGLFVICGVIFSYSQFSHQEQLIEYYSVQYFKVLSSVFSIKLESQYSDVCYYALQKEPQKYRFEICRQFENMLSAIPRNHRKWLPLRKGKYPYKTIQTIVLYKNTFENRLRLFIHEANLLLSRAFEKYDISTNAAISACVIQFICNGKKLPDGLSEISVNSYKKINYIKCI